MGRWLSIGRHILQCVISSILQRTARFPELIMGGQGSECPDRAQTYLAYGDHFRAMVIDISKGERMKPSVPGRCLCGESSYKFIGEVKFTIQCYCRDCQQISGGGHLPQVAVPATQFAAAGKIKTYQTKSDSGNAVEISFCGVCGSPLFKITSKMPDVRFLCAGSLAVDLVNEPFQKVYEEGRRIWDE